MLSSLQRRNPSTGGSRPFGVRQRLAAASMAVIFGPVMGLVAGCGNDKKTPPPPPSATQCPPPAPTQNTPPLAREEIARGDRLRKEDALARRDNFLKYVGGWGVTNPELQTRKLLATFLDEAGHPSDNRSLLLRYFFEGEWSI